MTMLNMSLNDLQTKLGELQRQRELLIHGYDKDIAETVEKIESMKSRTQQWTVYLSWNGLLYQTYGECPAGRTDKITVIEKKPVVITQEITYHFNSECQRLGTYSDQEILVSALKSIGIEARAGDD